MVHLVHPLINARIAPIRGQYDEIYVNWRVVYPWFTMVHHGSSVVHDGFTLLVECKAPSRRVSRNSSTVGSLFSWSAREGSEPGEASMNHPSDSFSTPHIYLFSPSKCYISNVITKVNQMNHLFLNP